MQDKSTRDLALRPDSTVTPGDTRHPVTSANGRAFDEDAAIIDACGHRVTIDLVTAGEALERIRASRSYLARGYRTFEMCVRERFDWSRQHGYRVIAAAKQAKALSAPAGVTRGDTAPKVTERQMRSQREPAERVRSFSKAQQIGSSGGKKRGYHQDAAASLRGDVASIVDRLEALDPSEGPVDELVLAEVLPKLHLLLRLLPR